MRREITCVICYERAKARRIFSKPKGWIKYRAPDGIIAHFDRQECLKKFIFPTTLEELEAKKLWRRFKIAFATLLAVTIVWTLACYLLSWYLLAWQYDAYLAVSGIIIIVAWIVTTRSYLKLRKSKLEEDTRMLKTAKMSEEEKLRKRELADKMAKKKARRDAIIISVVVFTVIWLVALPFSTPSIYLGLCVLGFLVSATCSWVVKESRYNKYYRIYLQ